jgi:hypothetical protein
MHHKIQIKIQFRQAKIVAEVPAKQGTSFSLSRRMKRFYIAVHDVKGCMDITLQLQ